MNTKLLTIGACAIILQTITASAADPLPKPITERIKLLGKSGSKITLLEIDKTTKGTYALIRATDGEFLSEEVILVKPDGSSKLLGGDASFTIFLETSDTIKTIPESTKKKFTAASEKENSSIKKP